MMNKKLTIEMVKPYINKNCADSKCVIHCDNEEKVKELFMVCGINSVYHWNFCKENIYCNLFYENNKIVFNDYGKQDLIKLFKPTITIIEFDDLFKDNINPSHYNNGNISCIEAMISAYGIESVMEFCKCNAFKYQWRFNNKNGEEDLEKGKWYIDKYIELQSKLNEKSLIL